MTRRKITFPIAILSLGLFSTAGTADRFTSVTPAEVTASPTQMPAVWTFDNCVEWAIENNTDVRKTLLNILQNDQEIGTAKDAWLPSVGFSTSHSFTNYPSPEDRSSNNIYGSSYGINASWTVWEGNIRKYRLESAKISRQRTQLSGDDLINDLKLNILQAYLNIMYAKETVTIASQTLEVSESQTERARRFMESGRTSKADFAQIESQAAQDRYNLVQAESNYATAKMNLKKILTLGLDYDLQIADVTFSDNDVTSDLPPMDQVYTFASTWLPELKSNELSKQIYANDIKIAKAGYLPSISLQGSLGTGYNSGGSISWGSQMKGAFNENIGVTLSIPIFDGNSTRRAVAKANLAAMEYDLDQKQLLDNLSQTIESLYIDANNAKAKYTSGITQLEATQTTADLVDRQFELGLVNPLELLTAHNNLLNARLELLQSKFMAVLAKKTIDFYATTQIYIP